MKPLPVIHATEEGGLYRLGPGEGAPIRIYADRWIEDDIAAQFTGTVKRKRLSPVEFDMVQRAAMANRRKGLVA